MARDPSLSSEGRSFDSKSWPRRNLTWEDWGPNQDHVLVFTVPQIRHEATAALEITSYFNAKEQSRNFGPMQLNIMVLYLIIFFPIIDE